MPKRKIPRNYRAVTGLFPSLKNGRGVAYESPLERDFFNLLEFDDDVLSYEEQPVKIPHKLGKKHVSYFPDCLITYCPTSGNKPLLVDIKTTEDIEENKDKFNIRTSIVSRYANEHDMEYEIFTEKDIRNIYLENLKFLFKYAKPLKGIEEVILLLKNIIAKARHPLTVSELLSELAQDRRRQLEMLPNIWHLVWSKIIQTDLEKRITMNSILELNSERLGE